VAQEGLAASKKNLGPHGTVVFVDESGFSESAVIRRTWAPRGQTPVLRTKQRSWSQASAIGALVYPLDGRPPRVLSKIHFSTVRTPQVVGFLGHLSRHVKGRVVVVWDGLAAHRARAVREWVDAHPRFCVERLPAYAPELNPVEGLWAWLKGSQLPNFCADTLGPVVKRARRGLKRAHNRPSLLLGFLHKASLSF
jgi:hypothetical protein